MALSDYLYFENPGVVAFGIGILIFVLAYTVLGKFIKDRASSILISIIFGITGGWYLYANGFLEWEQNIIALLFVAVVVVIVLKIVWSFGRGTRHHYRRF